MSILNPRENFLTDALAVKKFREFVDDPNVQKGVQSVLIEFAKTNPSSEAMKGANYVLERLVTFAEQPGRIKSWPDHSHLQHPKDASQPEKKSETKK